MTTPTRSLALIGTEALTWPLFGREPMLGEAGTTTLLRARVGGLLGRASPEERERIGNVLRSMLTSIESADIEDALTDGLLRPTEETPLFVSGPGHPTAGSVHQAIDALWRCADEAVFRFRQGDALGARSSLARALHEVQVEQATPLAAHLLLSYFVQRVLGLASEAEKTRKTLEKAYRREESL